MNLDLLVRKCNSLARIKQLQAYLVTTGLFEFSPSRTKLLELCAISYAGDLALAGKIFRQIRAPVTNDWNALIRGLALGSDPTRALACYRAMLRASHRPDALTCSFALKACARALALREASQLHSQIAHFGFQADALLATTLLDAYAKAGDLDGAHHLFDEMPVRDVASWNALVAGLGQGTRPGEALALFKRMREEGVRPNEITVLGALSACAQLGAVGEGDSLYSYIRDEKLDTNVQVCNAAIDMFAKCGFIDKASDVFAIMGDKKNLVSWNTMIMALAMDGDGHKALDLFKQMDGAVNRVHPDNVTYLAALCGCNHAGLVEDGIVLFNSMADHGVEPHVKHYGCVVDLLGRAGRLQEAYQMVVSMPLAPDVVLWQTLLGASKTHGDMDMAETVSRRLVEMGSNSCGDFVLLSNVYAAHEKWENVGKVREAMKTKDVKKVPGFSYIEAKGTRHTFHNGDQSHPDCQEIYRKLDEIQVRIREHGYVAETNYVLHDIGEEEKENALCYHSEKLAVAFGLISTGEGNPIQVIKNLRICGDCHIVIKLIARLYKREIIVRDRARFHRFKDGSCSCRDYW